MTRQLIYVVGAITVVAIGVGAIGGEEVTEILKSLIGASSDSGPE